MAAWWCISDVKECQVDIWRLFKDRFGIIDSCFSFAIAAGPVGQGLDVFKVEGLGELLVFVKHKLWTVVCKTVAKWALVFDGQHGQLCLISRGATGQIC